MPAQVHRAAARWSLALGLAVAGGAALAGPVGAALDRPALTVRQPGAVVLLAAARSGPRIVAVGERGVVAWSDDAGRTWSQGRVPTSVTLTAVAFAAGGRRGYAIGHGGVVLATDDAGEHWTMCLDGRRIATLMLDAAQARRDPALLREAQRRVAEGPDKPLLDLVVLDDRSVVVVGAYGLALATQDGGATWSSWAGRLDNPKGLHLYAIEQRGDRWLVAGEQGLVMASDDGGQRFRRVPTPYPGSFFTAALLSDDEMVVAGLRGNVWRSRDGGRHWTNVPSPVPASITASAQTAGGTVLMVNQAGWVLRLLDDRLVALNATALPSLTGLLPGADGTLTALTHRGAVPVRLTRGMTQ